jgi:outer membrane protein assembly factor BamB
MKKMTDPQQIIRLLRNIAIVAGAAAIFIAILLVLNYFQLKKADPLNSHAMKILVEELRKDPNNDQIRENIRELDLMARKAFFTSQWQINTGGLILLLCLCVVVFCIKAIDGLHNKIPDIPVDKRIDFWRMQSHGRSWIIFSGLVLIAVSFMIVVLTFRDMKPAFDRQSDVDSSALDSRKRTPQGLAGVPMNADCVLSAAQAVQKDTILSGETVSQSEYPSLESMRSNTPSFRGYGGLGIAYQKNIPIDWDGKTGRNILWKTAIPLPGFNSPVIWNDMIFLTGATPDKQEIYGIDAAKGIIRWTAEIKNIPGSPTQTPQINRETGHAAPTVTTDGRRIYAIFANGNLAALDMEGKIVWTKNLGLPKNHYGHSSSLIMYRDILIVQYDQTGNASVTGFKGATGEMLWKTQRNVRVSWASPVIVETSRGSELILAADPYVIGYDPETGKELWSMECISGEVGPSCGYADGVVFSVNEYSKVAAVKIEGTPELLWEDTEYLSDIPSPVAIGALLFMATSYGTVVCYDAATGNKNWIQEFDHPIYASPMVVDGKVFVLEKTGIMHIINMDKVYTLISSLQLGEGSVCTPAFANGRIFIRGDKHLFCIGE